MRVRYALRCDWWLLGAKTSPQDWNCRYENHGSRPIGIADAHFDDGKRFIVHADEKLTAFLEAERAIHQFAVSLLS
jgi:hypothetical protein